MYIYIFYIYIDFTKSNSWHAAHAVGEIMGSWIILMANGPQTSNKAFYFPGRSGKSWTCVCGRWSEFSAVPGSVNRVVDGWNTRKVFVWSTKGFSQGSPHPRGSAQSWSTAVGLFYWCSARRKGPARWSHCPHLGGVVTALLTSLKITLLSTLCVWGV